MPQSALQPIFSPCRDGTIARHNASSPPLIGLKCSRCRHLISPVSHILRIARPLRHAMLLRRSIFCRDVAKERIILQASAQLLSRVSLSGIIKITVGIGRLKRQGVASKRFPKHYSQ